MDIMAPASVPVPDDPNVLRWFDRVLHATCEVVAASNKAAGLHLLEQNAAFAVIISDLHLPGSDALNVLKEARRLHPDAARILLTEESTLRGAVSAVNQAGIFRLLVKPCMTSSALDAVTAGIRQFDLAQAEHVALEQTLRGSIGRLRAHATGRVRARDAIAAARRRTGRANWNGTHLGGGGRRPHLAGGDHHPASPHH